MKKEKKYFENLADETPDEINLLISETLYFIT
jgi:hypothetical protein